MGSACPPPGRTGGADGGRSNVDSSARTTVSCSGLTKSFNGNAVVREVALNITEGTIVGLIGPSGSGKTTTVRLLVGLLEPTAGTATVWNTTSTELSAGQRQRIGYLPQIPALFPNLSLWENLSFHASMYGLRMRRRRRLHHVLEWVELDEHRKKKVRQASGGMQRRLALAAALVHDPMLLFLDEPTAGIDPILRSTFWEHFREMRDEGRTICVTTQYVAEAAYCDYVGVLSDGELLLVDTPENLRKAAFHGEVVDIELSRAVEADEVEQLARLEGVLSRPEPLLAAHLASGRRGRRRGDRPVGRRAGAAPAARHRSAGTRRRLRRSVRQGHRATPRRR